MIEFDDSDNPINIGDEVIVAVNSRATYRPFVVKVRVVDIVKTEKTTKWYLSDNSSVTNRRRMFKVNNSSTVRNENGLDNKGFPVKGSIWKAKNYGEELEVHSISVFTEKEHGVNSIDVNYISELFDEFLCSMPLNDFLDEYTWVK